MKIKKDREDNTIDEEVNTDEETIRSGVKSSDYLITQPHTIYVNHTLYHVSAPQCHYRRW